MTPPSRHRTPEALGRFRIESMIGRGGMGEVYKAFDPVLNRTVALKAIHPGATDRVFLDRLYREASACGRLRHPNIVTVYDLGEADGLVFIAMEYLEGEPLGQAIDAGDITFEAKVRILIEILDALHYAHGEGVVHRDVKPSNVLVLPDGSTKLLDFGIARVARADSLTLTGDVMGTPYYMAPEQLKGQPVDHRADVYSAGVVAYELLTHRRAFDGTTLTEVMLKVLSEPPPPMDAGWSVAFPELERIVVRAMAKSADARYATAEDMKNALSAFLASSRAEIARRHAESVVLARRTVIEAQTLLAAGRVAESQALLAATLRAHPEASDVRRLHRDTLETHPHLSAAIHPPATPTAAPTAVASRPAPLAVPPAESVTGSAGNAYSARPAADSHMGTQTWPAPRRGGLLRRAASIAAVVLLSIAAIVMAERNLTPEPAVTARGASSRASASGSSRLAPDAVPNHPERRAIASDAAAAVPPDTATPPAASEPARAASADATAPPRSDAIARPPLEPSRQLQPDDSPTGASSPPARPRGPSAGTVSAGSSTELSRALTVRLTDLLRERGITPRNALRVTLEMSTRPAGFQATATTADWVATIRTAGGSQSFDGRVLGFSELALRNDVVERAADAIAAFLANVSP